MGGHLGLLRWRRVIDDDDLLGDPVLVKFTPIRVLLPTILGRSGRRAVSVLDGSHCGRGGGQRRRGSRGRREFGGLSIRESCCGGGCGRGRRRRRIDGVRIRGG